ncbi:hypothetical protein SLEP1_g9138 [Rubroshorea leprosula]|uniref:Uncharacterized protein n=1 Tax=Rubroshorea leprosula TaxID=152421 RepID=A0AAV5I3Z6_9ROSI|nr:hypothetical protein SLEP1_g9138 [Rubroshorea leprosula]
MPRPVPVRNKSTAPIQITAEQILREARERRDAEVRPPRQNIADPAELADAETEMKKEFVNHARDVWERAVALLPRVDQLWYKYIHMEEMLGNIAARARAIYERYVQCHPTATAWVDYAKFEMKKGETVCLKSVFERAVEKMVDDDDAEELFVAFAEFEERCKEIERARSIYKFALDHIPKRRAENLYKKFVVFEKQHGDKDGIDDSILRRRRFQCEDEVRKNPLNYDLRFDYIWIGRESEMSMRGVLPMCPQLRTSDSGRDIFTCGSIMLCTRRLMPEMLRGLVLFIGSALRARLIMGHAIGKAPKDKVFEKYIEMELNLGNVDRYRKLHEKYVECSPENCNAWAKYVELECSLGETERARAIFELALSQPVLDMPELLWKVLFQSSYWFLFLVQYFYELEESLIYGGKSAGIRRRSREVSERAITNTQAVSLKILEAAFRWKKQRTASKDPGEPE